MLKKTSMKQQDQAIQTDGRRRSSHNFGLTLKDLIKLLVSMILPLVLGIFTIISANNQQRDIIRQNERDGWLRQQEWQIANKHNELLRQMALEQYQDNLLVIYTKEMGDLLKESNGSLTCNSIISTIARAKTLNTIRQLDSSRSSNIIRFLYEARQLTNANETYALDISTIELFNVTKNIFKTILEIGRLFLTGIFLYNCTFNETRLIDIDISFTQFKYVNFSASEFYNITISSAELRHVEFISANLKDVTISYTQLNNVNFSSLSSHDVHHSCSRLVVVVDESFTRFINANFEWSTFQYVDFLFTKFQDTNFLSAKFDNVGFSSARLYNVSFRSAKLYKVDFSSATISYIDFSTAQLENVNFSFAELSHINFSSARLVNVNFKSATLHNVDFSKATLSRIQFSSASLGN